MPRKRAKSMPQEQLAGTVGGSGHRNNLPQAIGGIGAPEWGVNSSGSSGPLSVCGKRVAQAGTGSRCHKRVPVGPNPSGLNELEVNRLHKRHKILSKVDDGDFDLIPCAHNDPNFAFMIYVRMHLLIH